MNPKIGQRRASARFTSSRWTDVLIPAALILLCLVLVGTIVFVVLFAAGLI